MIVINYTFEIEINHCREVGFKWQFFVNPGVRTDFLDYLGIR